MCGYTFDDDTCTKKGAHYCKPRADRGVAFIAELLVFTKGPFARQQFRLEDWQDHEIVRPILGEVVWDPQWRRYRRRYAIAYIVVARKNGKSELVAALVLYLLVGDDEDAAEVYGAAKDTKQAGKVYQPVKRMVELSRTLRKRLTEHKAARRITDDRTASYYETITADALGELGHSPHGFVLDEVLSQPDRTLWDAMRTAGGGRVQPLMLAITTETADAESFGAKLIDEAERVQADPRRAPHVFAWVRKLPQNDEQLEQLLEEHAGQPDLPVSCDPWDERNWYWPNPALGSFKSLESMRQEAHDAREDPEKENAFRQFQLNQRVQQVTRWMPLTRWDATAGLIVETELEGRECYAGLDLASTTDLAAWVLLFPPIDDEDPYEVLWRFWTPEAMIPTLDKYLGGQASVWVRDGFIAATEGDWIDYAGDPDDGRSHHSLRGTKQLAIHPRIQDDAQRFRIVRAGYDQKEATATAQFMQALELPIVPVYQGFALSPALKEIMRLVKADQLRHGGHPVARWNADSAEIKSNDEEKIKLVKPARNKTGARVDGIAALATAIRAMQLEEPDTRGEDFAVVVG